MQLITTQHFDREIIDYYIDWNEEVVVEKKLIETETTPKTYTRNIYQFIHDNPNHFVSQIIKFQLINF